MNKTSVIPSEKVARKLHEAEDRESEAFAKQLQADPRLVELMWFIQWFSFQPGGIQRLADGLLAAFPERFVTEGMGKVGAPRGGRYSLAQCVELWEEVWRQLPAEVRHLCDYQDPPEQYPGIRDFKEWYRFMEERKGAVQGKGLTCDEVREGVEHFNWPYLKERCEYAARSELTEYLRGLCIDSHVEFCGPWYCPRLIETLFDYMGRHASEAGKRIAETEVSRQVNDAFDYAWDQRAFVRLDGDTRFGKSESARAYCAAHPGRFRMVTVPESNAKTDLIRAVGCAFGIESSSGLFGPALQNKVDYILKYGRTGLAFDEAHYLLPIRYSSRTSPERVNWLRGKVVDRELPCLLITTPQAFKEQMGRFVKVTGYNMAQFEGRYLHVTLPSELSKEDCLSVARFHCAEFGDRELKLAVGAALLSSSYLKALEVIGKRVRWIAKRRGASDVNFSDVERVVAEVLRSCAPHVIRPSQGFGPVQLEGETKALRPRVPRKPAAEVLRGLRPGRADDNFSAESGSTEGRMMGIRVPALDAV